MKSLQEINLEIAVNVILESVYHNEFEVIDGLNQHPRGINYEEWLQEKGIISIKNELK